MEKEQHQVRHAYLEEYEGASLVAIEAYQCLEFIYPPGLWPSIQKMISDGLKNLNKRLTEINALKSVEGSCIVKPFGHFR